MSDIADKGLKIDKNRISILGCGWLGFPLAQRLRREHSTWEIKGSTTSSSKLEAFKKAGITGYLLNLTPDFTADQTTIGSFFDTDTLIISLPPRLTKNEPGFYSSQAQAVTEAIRESPVSKVVFISSTGIYPDLNRMVSENDVMLPDQSASPEMVSAENLIASLRPERTVTVLRLGGLLGYNRNPGKYVKGQKDMVTGKIPVNYIHRDDAVGIILHLLEHGIKNETFNIVSPLHPTRMEVYNDTCAQFSWEAPTYVEQEVGPDFKIISSEKFTNHYPQYIFKYPDPLQFYYSLEDESEQI